MLLRNIRISALSRATAAAVNRERCRSVLPALQPVASRCSSSFQVSSLPSPSAVRKSRPVGQKRQGRLRPRFSWSINDRLHQLLIGIQTANLESAWSARSDLVAQGHGDKLSIRELRDLRKLLFRCYQGVAETSVDNRELLRRMREMADAAVDKAARLDSHGSELLHWVARFLGQGQDGEAIRLLHSYLDKAKLYERHMSFTDSSKSKGKAKKMEPSAVGGEDTSTDPLEELGTSTTSTEATANRLSPRILPPFINRLLTFLVYAHVSLYGEISRAVPILRMLPMPARQYIQLASDSQAMANLKLPTRIHTQEHTAMIERKVKESLPALRIAELAWGLDRPASEVGTNPLARIFSHLFSKRDSKSLQLAGELCDVLLKGTHGPQAWLWVEGQGMPPNHPARATAVREEEDDQVRTTRPDVTASTWAVLFRGFLGVKDLSMSGRIWSHLRHLGVPPSPRIYNGLLTGYTLSGQWESLSAVWIQLRRDLDDRGGPDAVCYTTMIHGLFKSGDPDEALAVFEELCVQAANEPKQFRIPPETYNAVIFGLLVADRAERAKSILSSMIASAKISPSTHLGHSSPIIAPAPSTATWNILLRAYARTGDFSALSQVLAQAKEVSSFQPDVISFVTVLDGLIRFGLRSSSANNAGQAQHVHQLVDRMFTLMQQSGIRMNTIAWTAVVKGVLANADVSLLADDADDDFDYSAGGMQGLGLSDATEVDVKLQQIRAGMSLLSRMMEEGVSPNEVTFTALVQSAVELQRACEDDLEAMHKALVGLSDDESVVLTIRNHLHPISELREAFTMPQTMFKERLGQALALALLSQMRGGRDAVRQSHSRADATSQRFHISPNRKTYHILLSSLLRSLPNVQSGQTMESSESARVAFVRGLALLDELTVPMAQQDSHPDVSSAMILLTPLDPTSRVASGSRYSQHAFANETSFRIVLDALFARYDRLQAIRGWHPHPHQTGPGPGRSGVDHPGIQVAKELQLTRLIIQTVLNRIQVAEQDRWRGPIWQAGRPVIDASPALRISASLDRMRERARQLLRSMADAP